MSDFKPGLLEALEDHAVGRGRSGPGGSRSRERVCTVCMVIEYATPGVSRDALIEAAAGRLSARALHVSLRQIGIQVSREAISNHRNEGHQP